MHLVLLVYLERDAVTPIYLFLTFRGADIIQLNASLFFSSRATGKVAVGGPESRCNGWGVAGRFAVE